MNSRYNLLHSIACTVIALLSIVALLLIFSSCNPVKRLGGLAAKMPVAARKVCNTMFPPDVSIIHDTSTNTVIEYRKGEPLTVYSYADCDSAIKASKPGTRLRIPCPTSTHVVDTLKIKTTITTTVTKTIINTSKEKELQHDLDKMTTGRNRWRWIGGIGLLLIAGVVGWKILKGKFGGLLKRN